MGWRQGPCVVRMMPMYGRAYMSTVMRVRIPLVAIVPLGMLVDVFRIVVSLRPIMTARCAVMTVLTDRRPVMAIVLGRRPVILVMTAGTNYYLRYANPNMDVDISLCGCAEHTCRKGKPKHQQSFHGDPLKTFSLL